MLKVTQLQKVVDQSTLIDIPNLSVTAGEITAVCGLTAVYKKTFIQLLIGQTPPTAGQVRLVGIDPHQERSAFAQKVGFLPAEDGFYERLTARQNLAFYCRLYGMPLNRAAELLIRVGLQDQASSHASELTPEMARRLALGRALIHNPQLLILVEPFSESSPASITIISRILRQQAADGAAVLLIAQENAAVTAVCQTVVIMSQGHFSHSYQPSEQEAPTNMPFKIPARLEGKVALVNPLDILYASSNNGRTFLCTENGRIPTHLTLSDLETRLARSGFFRAHRSYLVNMQHIKEIIAYTRDSYTLILDGRELETAAPAEVPLSKSAARDLRELLNY